MVQRGISLNHVLRATVILLAPLSGVAAELPWTSSNGYRIGLVVDPQGVKRSCSPVSVDIDFTRALAEAGESGAVDYDTIEVVALGPDRRPKVFDSARQGDEQFLLPHRVDRYFGISRATLNFVMPDETCTRYAVYFDTVQSKRGKPQRYAGLVGDGDFFREGYKTREINASRFDAFCDFDGDGDLDLFKGGVEPFVHSYENTGHNLMVDRGLLTSGGKVLMMPCHEDNGRGWMTVALDDWDGDGDQDLFCCMGDGPKAGQMLIYENTTTKGGLLTFTERGELKSRDGKSIGGRFVAISMVDWDGDGRKDVLCAGLQFPLFFRNAAAQQDLQHVELAEGVPLKADGKDFTFGVSKLDAADVDGDGDLDLFAAEGRGPIWLFMNTGTRTAPVLAAGKIVAYEEPYMIGDAHTGVKAADFDGDGRVDFVGGRFWERTPPSQMQKPRYYGGLFRNVGTAAAPQFRPVDAAHGSPHTEGFQTCDAVRQNAVRAVDWDNDKRLDLLAGDTDGILWYFHNETDNRFPVFSTGRRMMAGGKLLSFYGKGGHVRPDLCDWNNDRKKDVIIADGAGAVTLYLNTGTDARPVLDAGRAVEAAGKPIKGPGGRSSVIVCDWDRDGKKDLVLADQDIKQNGGYLFFKNTGTDAAPVFGEPKRILFNGKPVDYVRPNLGKCVDWDGDGKQDFIGCYFEVDVQFYKNVGSGKPGDEPQFRATEGVPIVHPFSVQMVSGADVIDFNGDGDLDVLTGQGHGGSGLRFFERDYIEDQLRHTRPAVTAGKAERKPGS
jgi:hypothetical protein